MWSPEGYYPWNHVFNLMLDTSREVLSLVSVGGVPPENADGQRYFFGIAEGHLIKSGIAEDYAQAELIVGITTTFLLARFFDEYPPIIANVEGNRIRPHWLLFEHRDQLEYCSYGWPLTSDPQFKALFEYARSGHFDTRALLDRFIFLDTSLGCIRVKNGAIQHLVNFCGMDHDEANRVLEFVKEVSGYIICWPETPQGDDFRDFLRCLEVNDAFTLSLNHQFGSPSVDRSPSPRRPVGRPKKGDEAARIYWSHFPNGHDAEGRTWKDALAVVNESLTPPIHEDTLKRAVRGGAQK